jgi:release factor glutamine methyltransferase
MMTIAEAARRLVAAGVPSARHDARVLSRHDHFDELVRRRAAREPLQYIIGSAPFRHLEILVGPGAFIPRPETELLAGWVIDRLRGQNAPVVIDLCSGPGTIALAVADELPGARVHAVEVDPVAAQWAKRNIDASGLPVSLHVTDICAAPPELGGTADAVVANPPYLIKGTVDQPEVRDFEPEVALYDTGDGLDVIRTVVVAARQLLRNGGLVAIEHGDDQGPAVAQLLRASGFSNVEDHRDLAGRDRFSTGSFQ